jgi:hypothetical protein
MDCAIGYCPELYGCNADNTKCAITERIKRMNNNDLYTLKELGLAYISVLAAMHGRPIIQFIKN